MKRIRLAVLVLLAAILPSLCLAQNPPRLSSSDAVFDGSQRLSDEGRYFCAMTTTPGTAYNLTGATQNAFLATQAVFTLFNGSTNASATRIFPERAEILLATAGTGGTRAEMAIAIDDIQRYASGGTAQVIKNTNMDNTTQTSIATVFGGDITAAAAGANVRYIGRGTISSAAQAVGQEYAVSFGGGFVTTAENGRMLVMPATVIGPGDTMVFHLWLPGLSAQPTGEVHICWIEK